MAMSKQAKNNAVVVALNHPVRRAIVRLLQNDHNGGLSPSMMADELKTPLGNVSYHVRTLEKVGVIKLLRQEPRRGAVEHFYAGSASAIAKKVKEALELLGKD